MSLANIVHLRKYDSSHTGIPWASVLVRLRRPKHVDSGDVTLLEGPTLLMHANFRD